MSGTAVINTGTVYQFKQHVRSILSDFPDRLGYPCDRRIEIVKEVIVIERNDGNISGD